MSYGLVWLAKFNVMWLKHLLFGRRGYDPLAVQYHLSCVDGGSFNTSRWRGMVMQKSPADLLMYAEAILETKPEVIVETGTWEGGSAAWFKDIGTALLGQVDVITVDIAAQPKLQRVPGVTYIADDSRKAFEKVRTQVAGRRCLVSLDADHSRKVVAEELELYPTLVPVGGYCIVEDTILDAVHPDNPMEALKDWLATQGNRWEVDRNKERLRLSFAPGGWLRRVA